MSGESWLVDNRDKAKSFCQYVMNQAEEGIDRLYSIKRGSRSVKQSNALHLWFRQLAEALNDAGFSQPHPWGKMQIPYSETAIKDLFFRPIIRSLYNKDSTKDLNTKELSESMEVLLDAVNEHTGVYVPFPQQD